MSGVRRTPRERFEAKVRRNPGGDCQEWVGAKTSTGYGSFYAGAGRVVMAHRWAYESAKGAIPSGLSIDHLCRNRGCVNPDHLEAVTQRENLMRGMTIPALNASKTHCPQEHPLFGVNLYVDPVGNRRCRICRRENNRVARRNLLARKAA